MGKVSEWCSEHLGGHISGRWPMLWTLYGFNAMHVCLNVWTRRWGWICFHPPVPRFLLGMRAPWYLYISPNATPWAATWGVGPGIDRESRSGMRWRRENLGHGFDSDLLDYDDMQPPHLRKATEHPHGRRE